MKKEIKYISSIVLSIIMAVVFIIRIEGQINVTKENIKNIESNHAEFKKMILEQNKDVINSIKELNKNVIRLDKNVIRLKTILENLKENK